MSDDIGGKTEKRASRELRKYFGKKAYIRKLPDYKQTGSLYGGLPDYMVIDDRDVYWFEIKHVDIKKESIPFSNFTDQQVIEFRRMVDAGAVIYVMIYFGNKLYIVRWYDILEYMMNNDRKSIPKKVIKELIKNV